MMTEEETTQLLRKLTRVMSPAEAEDVLTAIEDDDMDTIDDIFSRAWADADAMLDDHDHGVNGEIVMHGLTLLSEAHASAMGSMSSLTSDPEPFSGVVIDAEIPF